MVDVCCYAASTTASQRKTSTLSDQRKPHSTARTVAADGSQVRRHCTSDDDVFCLLLDHIYWLLGEEAVASPSNGNTSWRVSMMFRRPAMTVPEVNGFG